MRGTGEAGKQVRLWPEEARDPVAEQGMGGDHYRGGARSASQDLGLKDAGVWRAPPRSAQKGVEGGEFSQYPPRRGSREPRGKWGRR